MILVSGLLTLGCAPQAHARYEPADPDWTRITSTAAQSTATSNTMQDDADFQSGQPQTVTRTWNWIGNGNPTPATFMFKFSATTGNCSASAPEGYATSDSIVRGGIGSYETGEIGIDYFIMGTQAWAPDPPGHGTATGENKTFDLSSTPHTGEVIFEKAYVSSDTQAYAAAFRIGGTASATAGEATSGLTDFSLAQ